MKKPNWYIWFDKNVSHLDVGLLNLIASIFMMIGLIIEKNFWWVWFLLYGNLISALFNFFMSWKKDEFNRRKWKNIN